MNEDRETTLSELSEAVWARLEQSGFDVLSDAEKTFLSVWSTVGEVDNGGFEQFYFNASGDIVTRAPSAFRAIGADSLAVVIEKAGAVIPGGPAKSDAERQAQLENLSDEQLDRLRELNQSFDSADVDEFLWRFVKNNHMDIH